MTLAHRLTPLVVLLAACAAKAPVLSRSSTPAADEIWIVARTDGTPGRTTPLQAPRMLAGTTAEATPLPLERTEVEGALVGPCAAIRMRQTYAGPDAATDGAFVLPLPHGATLYDLVLTIGSRHIRAIVRPREEAEALYATALRSGRVASLLREQNGVVVGMANLAARTPIDVELSYAEWIPWRAGAWELVVPSIPAGSVGVTIDLDGVGPIATVESPTHMIDRADAGDGRVRVGLRDPASLHDDDLVLRYSIAADPVPSGGVIVASGTRGTAAMLVLRPVARHGRAMAFDVDTIDWGTLAVEGGARVTHVSAAGPEGFPFVFSTRVISGSPGAARGMVVYTGRRSRLMLPIRAAPSLAADALPVLLASGELESVAGDRRALRDLALRYGLVSSETTLVAIDATTPIR
jgi:hypothetical protein